MKKLAAIHPNVGLENEFRKKLEKLVDELHTSIEYWVLAAYKANKPAKKTSQPNVLASDATMASLLNLTIKRLTKRWNKRFSEVAKPIADYYAQAAKDRTDAGLRSALKKSGYTVEFRVTPEIQNVMTAAVNQNVSLIKSIASEYLSDVNELVMRSVSSGRSAGELQKELQARYGITKRRAVLIARTSNNQTSAMLERQRAKELGIKEAMWVHASGSRHPRKEHVDWNGKMFDMEKGMWSDVDGQYVWPGTPINCHCIKRMILKTVSPVSEATRAAAR